MALISQQRYVGEVVYMTNILNRIRSVCFYSSLSSIEGYLIIHALFQVALYFITGASPRVVGLTSEVFIGVIIGTTAVRLYGFIYSHLYLRQSSALVSFAVWTYIAIVSIVNTAMYRLLPTVLSLAVVNLWLVVRFGLRREAIKKVVRNDRSIAPN